MLNLVSKNETHRLSNHPLYKRWAYMIQRCYNPNNVGYRNYGGRNIKVCPRWRNSPATYIRDIENLGWTPNCKLEPDRKDNNLGYSPQNIRLGTRRDNANNRRCSFTPQQNRILLAAAEGGITAKHIVLSNKTRKQIDSGITAFKPLFYSTLSPEAKASIGHLIKRGTSQRLSCKIFNHLNCTEIKAYWMALSKLFTLCNHYPKLEPCNLLAA